MFIFSHIKSKPAESSAAPALVTVLYKGGGGVSFFMGLVEVTALPDCQNCKHIYYPVI